MSEYKTKENLVLFVTKWKIKPEHFIDAIKRFTSGDPSEEFPEGVRLVGRWHIPASNSGVAVVEADNAESAIRWTLKWNDLMDITLEPAVEDETGVQMAIEQLSSICEN